MMEIGIFLIKIKLFRKEHLMIFSLNIKQEKRMLTLRANKKKKEERKKQKMKQKKVNMLKKEQRKVRMLKKVQKKMKKIKVKKL